MATLIGNRSVKFPIRVSATIGELLIQPVKRSLKDYREMAILATKIRGCNQLVIARFKQAGKPVTASEPVEIELTAGDLTKIKTEIEHIIINEGIAPDIAITDALDFLETTLDRPA